MKNKKINLTLLLNERGWYHTLIEYIYAVDILYKNTTSDKISTPLLYLVRHSIEIGLKSTILYLCEKSDSNSIGGMLSLGLVSNGFSPFKINSCSVFGKPP